MRNIQYFIGVALVGASLSYLGGFGLAYEKIFILMFGGILLAATSRRKVSQ